MTDEPTDVAPVRLSWDVVGLPRPKGSKRLLPVGGITGARGVLVESAGPSLTTWSETVAVSARQQRATFGRTLLGPVGVDLVFRFRMPKSRRAPIRRVGWNWASARPFGDGDKLTRAVWDSLVTGGLLYDDSQICVWNGTKTELADGWLGVEIDVYELSPLGAPYAPRDHQ